MMNVGCASLEANHVHPSKFKSSDLGPCFGSDNSPEKNHAQNSAASQNNSQPSPSVLANSQSSSTSQQNLKIASDALLSPLNEEDRLQSQQKPKDEDLNAAHCSCTKNVIPTRAILTLYTTINVLDCKCKPSTYHCPICPDGRQYTKDSVWHHIYQTHIQMALNFYGFFVSACNCADVPLKNHFHCVMCLKSLPNWFQLARHYETDHLKDSRLVEAFQQHFICQIPPNVYDADLLAILCEILTSLIGTSFYVSNNTTQDKFIVGTLQALMWAEKVLESAANLSGVKSVYFWSNFVTNLPNSLKVANFLSSTIENVSKTCDIALKSKNGIENQINNNHNNNDKLTTILTNTSNQKISLNLFDTLIPLKNHNIKLSNSLNSPDLYASSQFKCIFCNSYFAKDSFLEHFLKCQNSNPQFSSKLQKLLKHDHFATCVACWNFFGFTDDFFYHMFEYSRDGKQVKKMCCSCPENYDTCFELIMHKETHHEAYLCQTCNMIYENENLAAQHCLFYHQMEQRTYATTAFSRVISIITCNKLFEYISRNFRAYFLVNFKKDENGELNNDENRNPPPPPNETITKLKNRFSSEINQSYLKKNIHQLHDLAPNTTTTLLNNQNYNHNQNHDISNKKTESSKTHLRNPNLENQDSSAKRLKKHISEVALNKKTLLCDSKRSNIKQPASPASPRQDLATTFGAEIDTSDNMHCILCKTALKDSHAALRLHYKTYHQSVCSKVTFKCSLCPYSTQYRSTYSNHVDISHSRANPDDAFLITVFCCQQCEKECLSQEDLVAHFRLKHGGVENFPMTQRQSKCNRDPSAKSRGRPKMMPVEHVPTSKVNDKLKLLGEISINEADITPRDDNIFDGFF